MRHQDQNPGIGRATTGAANGATSGDGSQPARPPGRTKRASLVPYRDQIASWVRQGASDQWIARALGTSANSVQSFRSRSGILRGGGGSGDRSSSYGPTRDSGFESASVYEGVLEHGEGEEAGYGLWLDPAVADDAAFKKGFSGVEDVEVCIGWDRIVIRPSRSINADGRGDHAGDTVDEERLAGFQPGLDGFEVASGTLPASNREREEVKFFEPEKGYGFIRRPEESGGGEIFVHKSEINGADQLAAGLPVSYEVGSNQRGLVAEDVKAAG